MYLSEKKKIYYNYINKNSKKPCLVFVHGLGVNWTVWKDVIKRLKNPILYLDLRGHGQSQSFDSYKLEEFSKDLNEILNKEKIKKLILIGHSMGGMISLIFHKMFRSKVKKLILIDTTYKHPIPFWYNLIYPLDVLLTILFTYTPLKKLIKCLDFSKFKNTPNYFILPRGMFYRRNIQLKCIKGIRNYDVTYMIKSIQIPTLIIGSTQDELFSQEVSEEMHKYIKRSELKMLEGNHGIIVHKPKLISDEINKFIK